MELEDALLEDDLKAELMQRKHVDLLNQRKRVLLCHHPPRKQEGCCGIYILKCLVPAIYAEHPAMLTRNVMGSS